MSRNEYWSDPDEIKRRFGNAASSDVGAGPVVYAENGKLLVDDGEAHIAVIGQTGKGKSQCQSMPFARLVLDKNESGIFVDPKGELYRHLASHAKNHRVIVLDFRNPGRSPERWNPLAMPYKQYKSGDLDAKDVACSSVGELWDAVYPVTPHEDPFWPTSAANFAKGITYALFDNAKSEEITINNVFTMMEEAEEAPAGSAPFPSRSKMKSLYELLPSDSLAKKNLATYVTGPGDTRGSIHAVAVAGLEVFSRSQGLMSMLSDDTLNIMELDVDRPFAIFIITPDETNQFDTLVGILVSQISQHLIRVAQDRGGKLPIRVNMILEELGSVGKSIPALPNLLVAGRSRNIRIMLILQSRDQLIDVYGKSKAETIYSCIGITVGFSTNSWETLTEWSHRCGERDVMKDGHLTKEPLITATQLAAMPTGTALVLADSRYKFVTHFPFYNEMFDNSDWKEPDTHAVPRIKPPKPFDFSAFLESIKAKKEAQASEKKKKEPASSSGLPPMRPYDMFGPNSPFSTHDVSVSSETLPSDASIRDDSQIDPEDIDEILARIDKKIAALELEEAKEDAETDGKKYHVLVTAFASKRQTALRIASVAGESPKKIEKKLDKLPYLISFKTRKEASKFIEMIKGIGGNAEIDHKEEE